MQILLNAVLCYFCILCLHFVTGYDFDTDKPCAARNIPGQSAVCVCNVSYCDTITRIKPKFGTYVAYTTSESGSRFRKTFGELSSYKNKLSCGSIFELDPQKQYQVIKGFGGAATDSAGINWKSLESSRLRQHLVNSYCSKLGLEYNLLRVPIGGSDFSTHPYTYDEVEDDDELSHFKLTKEDTDYKIPLIKACMDVSTSRVLNMGSLWSPPTWMKTVNNISSGYLKEEHYQTLANYFIKFLEKYDESGIPFWAITTTNEPLSGILFESALSKLQWTLNGMGKWIVNNLGPTIKKSKFKDVKILGCDDQRFTIPMWFNTLLKQFSAAQKYIDGIGVHFYFDELTPPTQITLALKDYPDKFVIVTEACTGTEGPPDKRVILGSWSRGEFYASNIIENLNHKVAGWIDWNICLDESGGPNWIDNFVDSPIIVSAEKQEFYKQPMFYVVGHFSKFVPRGSIRIKVTGRGNISDVENVAFLTPENTIVMILFNKSKRRDFVIKLGSQFAVIDLEPRSITTVEFSYKNI